MQEPVITHDSVMDTITLEDKYNYAVCLTIGLAEHGDFYLKIVFLNLSMQTLVQVDELYKSNRELKFSSILVSKEGYDITHIAPYNMASDSSLGMVWECLSDEPGPPLIM